MEKTVEIKPFKKSETMRFAFNVTMKRQAKDHKLNDVVIKATQIKFYHKGDTLVFNADAFNLAQGSMLDNLIKSIPGAELNDDGEIKVNGRKVDALLLNGEDFFKGKNHIMLENLPVYMVKDLKVYERRNQFDMLTGKAPQGEYVIDVNLKKQYSIGAIGNVEAGMGSENRYLARLFALRFTDASRISANTNDLVWNARLSKTFAKAGITLMVDGFDILGNLSNISQVINSQGRTETCFNSLPRYVMAHAIYRFNRNRKTASDFFLTQNERRFCARR